MHMANMNTHVLLVMRQHISAGKGWCGAYIIESVDIERHQDGAEDLLLVAVHVGGDVAEDGGAQPVAVGIAWNLNTTSVQQHLGALLLTEVDQVDSAVASSLGDHWSDISASLVAYNIHQIACTFVQTSWQTGDIRMIGTPMAAKGSETDQH